MAEIKGGGRSDTKYVVTRIVYVFILVIVVVVLAELIDQAVGPAWGFLFTLVGFAIIVAYVIYLAYMMIWRLAFPRYMRAFLSRPEG